ncbi:sigma-70 family RNA polymerase sigma factor [Facklamia hominis]
MKKRFITVKTAKQINGQSVYVYEDIEVSEEVYLEMMRPEWREQKRNQRWYEDLNRLLELEEVGSTQWMSSAPDKFKALGGTGELIAHLRMGRPLSLDQINGSTNFDATSLDDPVVEAEASLLYEAFDAVLDEFSERDKLIMSLLLIDELTEREVAEIVGCSQKTVNNTKRKLLPIIQEALKDWQ